MAAKCLSIPDGEPSLRESDGFPLIDGSGVDTASPVYIARLLARIESRDQESPISLDGPEMDAYRIGLIPVENISAKSGFSISVPISLDSVLVLPFTWNELMTRVRDELGQARSTSGETVIRFGIATANFQRMEAFRSGERVALTPVQFKVLEYFVRSPFRVISRDELLNKVWGYNHYPTTRTVDNTVLRLRQALEPIPAEPVHFCTVHGVGYKFIP
jgi:DNA-binding winged helix-turn-helix (wHTH) protein